MLRDLGLEVRSVASVAAALDLAAREDFDMALVDVGLAADGAEGIVAKLRARTSVPSVLVLAGEDSVRRAIRILDHGADDYLVRPLDRAEVMARLGRILEWQHADDRRLPVHASVGRQKGKFELAEGGTIFLDEVGEMDLRTQAKLLRVLEEREFMRVGGGREVRVDVRVLAATNSELEDLIRRGRLREDLYFRLKVITIRVPPLRERQEDIPELARTLLEQIRRDNGLRPRRLTARAIRALQRYPWPGNVRELKNVLESTAITREGEIIRATDLPEAVLRDERPGVPGPPPRAGATMREMERQLIRRTLARHDGNRTHAARTLHIGVRTLQRKIKHYGIRVAAVRGRRPAVVRTDS